MLAGSVFGLSAVLTDITYIGGECFWAVSCILYRPIRLILAGSVFRLSAVLTDTTYIGRECF